MSDGIDWVSMMEGVARLIWGDPNPRLGNAKELRWGDTGKRSVDLEKGTWFHHQLEVGGGVLDLIKTELGLEGEDAFGWLRQQGFRVGDDRRNEQAKPLSWDDQVVSAFDYVDEKGKLLFQVCRLEDGTFDPVTHKKNKTFRQRRPDSSKRGGWNWKVQGVRRVMWRLPDIIAAVAAGRPIVIIEGEKAASAAVSIGLDATTNAGGAGQGKWLPEFNDYLVGATVYIVPDNDDAGRNHAQGIAAGARTKAKVVKIVDLPVANEKDDFYEWVHGMGGTAEEFLKIAEAAPSWLPERPRSMFGAVEFREMDQPGAEHEWMIKGMLNKRGTGILAGESMAGKSFLALQTAFHVAMSEPFHGRRVEGGLVLYQAGEGGLGLKNRMRGLRNEMDIPSTRDVPFVLLPGELDLYSDDEVADRFIKEGLAWKAYYNMPIAMVVIDTFSTATPGANENDGKDISRVLQRCARIRDELETYVLIVHHMNAEKGKVRGHTSITANVDNIILVSKMDQKDTNGRDKRKAQIFKNKEGEDGFSWQFVLRQVEIGTDRDGEAKTTCVVEAPAGGDDPIAEAKGYRLNPTELMLYDAIKHVTETEGREAPMSRDIPRGIRQVADYAKVQERMMRVWDYQPDENDPPDVQEKKRKDAVRKIVSRTGVNLMNKGIIGKDASAGENGYTVVWVTGKPVRGRMPRERAPEPKPTPTVSKEDADEILGW